MDTSASARRTSWVWYLVAAVIAVVAPAAGLAWIIADTVAVVRAGTQFAAPGRHTLHLDRPGTYVIWNNYKTFHDGRTSDNDPNLPAPAVIKVRDVAHGDNVRLDPTSGSSESSAARASVSVCSFPVSRPGDYEITVTWPQQQPQRILMVRPSVLEHFVAALKRTGLITLLAWGACVAMAVAVARKRRAQRHPMAV